jgi:hypothetical protein
MPALHVLKAERAGLHGHFSRDLPPVLTIESTAVNLKGVIPSWTTGMP